MGFAISDIQLASVAFEQAGKIPSKHTGEGEDVSPALSWSNVPDGTRSFVIMCHDPDAPVVLGHSYGFVHWVLYNIPVNVTSLPEGTSDFTSGITDFGKPGYGGPMPPNGHGAHNYYFWVLALNDDTQLESGLTLWQLLGKIEPKVIGMNRLVGSYERK